MLQRTIVSTIAAWSPGFAAGLLLALVFSPLAVAGEFTLRVDGLACPFCAHGVEKKLLAVSGVRGIDVLIDEGKVVLELDEEADLDAPALHAAVEKAGFTLRGLLVRDLRGALSRDDEDELLLTCSDPRATFRLEFEMEDATPGLHPGVDATEVTVSGTVTDFVSPVAASVKESVTSNSRSAPRLPPRRPAPPPPKRSKPPKRSSKIDPPTPRSRKMLEKSAPRKMSSVE